MNAKNNQIIPKDGKVVFAGIVARISGCASQKEVSLDDQIDHSKEAIAEFCCNPIAYQIIKTKGKGERLDRPELAEIEKMIRSNRLDVLVMEDVGRLIRGVDAVRLWGIAVDHNTRCIAPNDCVDSNDESWEEDLISACRDHVGHNAHTSKRLKKKLMNRFVKSGGATPCEIAGYFKPEGAKTFADWIKNEELTTLIQEGAALLIKTLNCAEVADFFNENGMPVGKYCRKRKDWYGAMVRRFFANPILKGTPARGNRHSVKQHETGRRISVRNPAGPKFVDFPHLAHLDAVTFASLNELLKIANANYRRKQIGGVDTRSRIPRTRTIFPGQHARCYYCGRHYVWGGNGMAGNLMCSGSREWQCWNSIGFSGAKLSMMVVDSIHSELFKLDGIKDQFADLVQQAVNDNNRLADRWKKYRSDEEKIRCSKENLVATIMELGPRDFFANQLLKIEDDEQLLALEFQKLQLLQDRQLEIPSSVTELRGMFKAHLERLAIESIDCTSLLNLLVPEVFIYLVRSYDGGHLLPRAKVKLNLAGISSDLSTLPEFQQLLSKDYTFDLFEPAQRHQIMLDAVRLNTTTGLTHRQIADEIETKPTSTAVQRSLALFKKMEELGLTSPYITLFEPPADYSKLRKHKNKHYNFSKLPGYVPAEL